LARNHFRITTRIITDREAHVQAGSATARVVDLSEELPQCGSRSQHDGDSADRDAVFRSVVGAQLAWMSTGAKSRITSRSADFCVPLLIRLKIAKLCVPSWPRI
jgi:hypothetical protein